MNTYMISLNGCDDTTTFGIELTDDEFRLIKRIEELSKKHSSYSCMPTLDIEENNYEFKTVVENETRYFEEPYYVVDYIEDKTAFEVDSQDLKTRLRDMTTGETLELREDCIIVRL